jgi:hypothetical protein
LLRTFQESVEIGLSRMQPVLRVLDAVLYETVAEDQLITSVDRVREEISQKHGDRDVLSLTNKFLWLKYRYPVIIYDRNVETPSKSRAEIILGMFVNGELFVIRRDY